MYFPFHFLLFYWNRTTHYLIISSHPYSEVEALDFSAIVKLHLLLSMVSPTTILGLQYKMMKKKLEQVRKKSSKVPYFVLIKNKYERKIIQQRQ